MLDDRTAANRDLDAARNRLWNNTSNRAGWKAYLGQDPGVGALAPYAAALRRSDLTGLPATWIGIGDIELFYAESFAYAVALRGAGVETTLDVVPGAPHAFESIAS
ncbi:alpha/beta hydrolase fold domain-containing protein [Cryobacterium sp. AP23]